VGASTPLGPCSIVTPILEMPSSFLSSQILAVPDPSGVKTGPLVLCPAASVSQSS